MIRSLRSAPILLNIQTLMPSMETAMGSILLVFFSEGREGRRKKDWWAGEQAGAKANTWPGFFSVPPGFPHPGLENPEDLVTRVPPVPMSQLHQVEMA